MVDELTRTTPSTDSLTQPHPGHRLADRVGRIPPAVGVVVLYVVIGVIAFWPVIPRISQGLLGSENDYGEFIWFLSAVTHQIVHGQNPFFSHALFAPTGINLAQNTTSPLLDLIMAPVTVAFGPAVSANVLLLIAMPLSASAAYLVLRRWQVWWPAAAVGGLMYGFSPYMIGQGEGHVQLLFLPLPPLIVLMAVSIVQGRGSPVRLGIALAVLVAAQFLISEEIAVTVILFLALGVVCVALRHPSRIGALVRTAWPATAIAVVVGVVLLAYPIWMTVAGPQHFTGSTFPITNPYHNDLLSFVAPGPLDRVPLGMRALGLRVLAYNDSTEAASYLGIPLLVVAAFLAWRSRRSPRMQLSVLLAVVAAVLSLGPHLTVDAHLTSVPLPFLVLGHLPLLDNLLPDRFAYEMDTLMAAVIAFGLDDVYRVRRPADRPARSPGARRGVGLSVALLGLVLVALVVSQLPQWPYAGLANQALPSRIDQAIPAGNPVAITYPYNTAYVVEPMLWQAEDGLKFRLLGGYAYHPITHGAPSIFPSIMDPPDLQHFLGAQEGATMYGPPLKVDAALVASTKVTLTKYHIRLIIVDASQPGSGPVVDLFTQALGPPKVTTGFFELWTPTG